MYDFTVDVVEFYCFFQLDPPYPEHVLCWSLSYQ